MAAPRLVIMAEFHVKREYVAECERVLSESARASRAEPGCVRFDVLRDHADPCRRGGRCRWAWPSVTRLLADGGLRMQLLYRACAMVVVTMVGQWLYHALSMVPCGLGSRCRRRCDAAHASWIEPLHAHAWYPIHCTALPWHCTALHCTALSTMHVQRHSVACT